MNPLKFIPIAQAVAGLSKDPSQQVGAVVVDDDGAILSVGYNGFPRGVEDSLDRLMDRSVKLKLICHAEQNAISQAARNGAKLKGATLVVTALYPCVNCCKAIIQSGIVKVLAPKMDSEANPQWHEEAEISKLMFDEAGVVVIEYD